MQTLRFLFSYLLMFLLSLIPMILFGDATVAVILMVMMNAGYAVGMGPISLGWNFPLAFLAVTYLTHEPSLGLLFAITVVLPVLCAYFIYPKTFSFGQKLCATTAALFIPYSLWEMESLKVAGYSVMQLMEESMAAVVETVGSTGILGEAEMGLFATELQKFLPYMEGVVPLFYLITSFVGAYLILQSMDRMKRQLSTDKKEVVPSFGKLRLPVAAAILFLPMILGISYISNQTVQIYLLNGVLLVGFLGVACGLSMVDYYLSRTVKSGFIRFIIYIFAINMTSMLAILPLILMGILDGFFNFRHINRT